VHFEFNMSSDESRSDGISSSGLFGSIGQKVQTVDTAAIGGDGATEDGDEKVVEEIESLCMNCHENVSSSLYFVQELPLTDNLGNHSTTLDLHTILSRNNPHVLLVR
jgi:hypothetical protein